MSLSQAIQALKNRDFAAAIACIDGIDPAAYTIQHFLVKGLAELALKDWPAANATFAEAAARFPRHALFWLNKGIAEENLGLIDAAIASQQTCLTLLPTQGDAAGNLSNLYLKKKRFAEAEQMARQAMEDGASKADALNSLGLALGKQGRFTEAEAALDEACSLAPNNAAFLANRANLAGDQLKFDQAWTFFAAARAIDDRPVFRRDEGMMRLLTGDTALGWPLYEARLEMPNALRLRPACPRWNGESLAGKKLLVLAEQGFGDVIQFCRYQEFLPDAELVWAVPKILVRLLSDVLSGTVLCETDPLPACDYYVPIMSLPLLTGKMSRERNPLSLEGTQAANAAHRPKIGLVWAGSPTHERDHERSLRLEQLKPIIEKTDADFYAPFVGAALDQIGALPVRRLDHLLTDFADTAALLKQMDCLITVDTAVAHLAGALGIPTYLLLTHCPDWRWGVAGETTDWYPSLHLVRQPRYGDWDKVISELAGLLKRRLRKPA